MNANVFKIFTEKILKFFLFSYLSLPFKKGVYFYAFISLNISILR